jgi:hypothetical protein
LSLFLLSGLFFDFSFNYTLLLLLLLCLLHQNLALLGLTLYLTIKFLQLSQKLLLVLKQLLLLGVDEAGFVVDFFGLAINSLV